MFIVYTTLIYRIAVSNTEVLSTTHYDILRDTVLIVLGFLAVVAAILGVSLYLSLRTALESKITQKATKHIDDECRRLRAQVDIQAGVIEWHARAYDRAIEYTQRALTKAEILLSERQVTYAKSNLGFYYAEKHKVTPVWHLKEESIALTKIGFDKYSPTAADFNRPDWVDNYIFARTTFVRTTKEKAEVLALIDSLLAREDLQSIKQYLEESKAYVLGLTISN